MSPLLTFARDKQIIDPDDPKLLVTRDGVVTGEGQEFRCVGAGQVGAAEEGHTGGYTSTKVCVSQGEILELEVAMQPEEAIKGHTLTIDLEI